MSVHPQGKGRYAPASLTIFHDRLSRMVAANREPHAFQGFEVDDGRLPDGSIKQVVMLGPQRGDKSPDRKSTAVPLADGDLMPKIAGDGKVFHGSFHDAEDGTLELVRAPKTGFVTRIFRTGLIRSVHAKSARGARQRDLAQLRAMGIKPGYHGIFPLERGSVNVAAKGETVEVMAVANVFDLTSPNAHKLKGTNVAESREMGAEIPIGGAVMCGDLGFLTIHDRPTSSNEVDIWDVTDDPEMWELFYKYAAAQAERDAEEEKKLKAAAGGEEPPTAGAVPLTPFTGHVSTPGLSLGKK